MAEARVYYSFLEAEANFKAIYKERLVSYLLTDRHKKLAGVNP